MIQRYSYTKAQKSEGGKTVILKSDIIEHTNGAFVKWDDVKDQLEWRELNEKSHPEYYQNFLICEDKWDEPRIVYLDEDDDYGMIFELSDQVYDVKSGNYKWKYLDHPWKESK